MRIEQVEVSGLFGHFDYVIHLNNTITIIHGPNGCGKTTVFRIIDAVFNKKLEKIVDVDFDYVIFAFSDGRSLKVERKSALSSDGMDNAKEHIYFIYSISSTEGEVVFQRNSRETLIKFVLNSAPKIPRFLPWVRRLEQNTWMDAQENDRITSEQLIERYGDYLCQFLDRRSPNYHVPEEVLALLSEFDVRLITADRLTVQTTTKSRYGEDDVKIERQVTIFADKLANKIREVIQQYAELSQEKDRTFLHRVIKQTSWMTLEQIKEKMLELEDKRKDFIDAGILEESKDEININELIGSISENEGSYLALLSLYVMDTEEKLNVLSELSASINLFRKWIDNSFNYKRITFNKKCGFQFESTYSDTIISPEKLSSGEQHELVMFYDLIFNTSEKSLILIDEPELSLHVKWQLDYVDELLRVISSVGFSTVLATHSPQIINGKWDMVASLSRKG